jgi:glyoxylase-like metal-dependent hydrolase (beta-lactamase superfamily II)
VSGEDNALKIEQLVTSGTFSLDGGTWDVDNNVWIVGNDEECVIIDPAHDPAAITAAVAGRTVKAILLTHGHDDHIAAVGQVRGQVNAPVYLNRDDWMLWERVFPGSEPDHAIEDRPVLQRLPHHHRLHPEPAPDPPRGDVGADRAWRFDDDRRRGPAASGMDRAGALSPSLACRALPRTPGTLGARRSRRQGRRLAKSA